MIAAALSADTVSNPPAPSGFDEPAFRRRVAHVLRGRYRLLELLGRGGMSVVYGADEIQLGRRVALKILQPEFGDALVNRERFRREARVLAGFEHPGIVPVYTLGEGAGLPFFTMRWVRGRSLAASLDRADSRMAVPAACDLIAALADSLDAIHRAGIVHRDIKPANVLLDEPGGRPVLIDFGVATVATSDQSRAEVARGFGTLEYMCPEQALGEVEFDARGDIYSLGVVAFQALTGRLPFRGSSAREIIAQHVARPAPAVSVFRPDVPQALDEAVARCLAKAPSERWPTAAAARDGFRTAMASTDPIPPRRFLGRIFAR